jgi:GntR family transcriptional regulator
MPARLTVNPRSGYPLYLQIVDQVERAIAIGLLCPGEQLPTVKQLSGELVINASTVAKALNELEHRGAITALPGKGTYVSQGGVALAVERTVATTVGEGVERVVREARALAIEGRVLRDLFERAYAATYGAERVGAGKK